MESPTLGLSLFGLLVVAVLILTNAYFVATEFALVAVRRTQIQLWVDEGRRGARSASIAIKHLDDAIAATQLGITLASIGLGFVGEPSIARLIAPVFASVGLGSAVAVHSAAVVVAFAIITFLHVVVGELAPKALALDRPGQVALRCARPLLIFGRIFRPILVFMNGAGNGLVRLFGVRPTGKDFSVHSAEELLLLVIEARDAGEIRPYAGKILGNVFRMSRTQVRDVMVPREKILAIDKSTDPEMILELLKGSGYTRLPVYDGDLDKIVGILHVKPFLIAHHAKVLVDLPEVDAPDFVPEMATLEQLLEHLRSSTRQSAIVVDEYGGTAGIVSIEDVVEEIVGDIVGADESSETLMTQISSDAWRVSGKIHLTTWADSNDLTITDAHASTLGGFITERLGRAANVGDSIDVGTIRLEVERMKGSAITSIIARMNLNPVETDRNDTPSEETS